MMDTFDKLLVIVLVSQVRWTSSYPEYREECVVWDNVTHVLTTEKNVEMSCQKNMQCTGFDCSGTYSYSGIYTLAQTFEVDFCFGLALHPCSKPVDMHFYIERPGEQDSFQETITNSTQVQIPGLSYDLQIGTADGFVEVKFKNHSINDQPYADIELVFKVRVKGGPIERWPTALQRTLMPPFTIPIPQCNSNVATPTHPPNTCVKFNTQKPSHVVTGPPQTGAKCTDSSGMQECAENEMCHTKMGICKCMPGYVRKHGKNCVSKDPQKPRILPYQEGDSDGKPRNMNTIVISVTVVAVCLIGIGIFTFFMIRYKKQQQRYGQHQMLVNEDDDDPLDVST